MAVFTDKDLPCFILAEVLDVAWLSFFVFRGGVLADFLEICRTVGGLFNTGVALLFAHEGGLFNPLVVTDDDKGAKDVVGRLEGPSFVETELKKPLGDGRLSDP